MWKGQVHCNPGPVPYLKVLQQLDTYRGPQNLQEAVVDSLQQADQIPPTTFSPYSLSSTAKKTKNQKTAASPGVQHRYAFCNTFTSFPHLETQVDSTTLKIKFHPKTLLSNFVLPTEEGIGTRAVGFRQPRNHPETLEENTARVTPQQLSASVKMCKDHLDAPLAAAWALARGELRRLVSARTLDHTADNCMYQVSRQQSNRLRHPLPRSIWLHQDDRHRLRRKTDLHADPVGWRGLGRVPSAYWHHWTQYGVPSFRGHLHQAMHNRYV